MKRFIIRLLMRLANRLYSIEIKSHDKIVRYQDLCLDEINRLVLSGKYRVDFNQHDRSIHLTRI